MKIKEIWELKRSCTEYQPSSFSRGFQCSPVCAVKALFTPDVLLHAESSVTWIYLPSACSFEAASTPLLCVQRRHTTQSQTGFLGRWQAAKSTQRAGKMSSPAATAILKEKGLTPLNKCQMRKLHSAYLRMPSGTFSCGSSHPKLTGTSTQSPNGQRDRAAGSHGVKANLPIFLWLLNLKLGHLTVHVGYYRC